MPHVLPDANQTLPGADVCRSWLQILLGFQLFALGVIGRQDFQRLAHCIWELFCHQPRTALLAPVIELVRTHEMKSISRLPRFALVVCIEHRQPDNQKFNLLCEIGRNLSYVLQRAGTVKAAATGWRKECQESGLRSVAVEFRFQRRQGRIQRLKTR